MTTKTQTFNLRLPPELRDKIKAVAEQEHRSINSEIIHLLATHPDVKKED